MAKQIIALAQNSEGDGLNTVYVIAFWFPITSGLQPSATPSAWTGASTAENSAITAGSIKEEVRTFTFPTSITTAAIKAVLQQYWTNRNSQLNGVGANQVYGVFFDSVTGWSA